MLRTSKSKIADLIRNMNTPSKIPVFVQLIDSTTDMVYWLNLNNISTVAIDDGKVEIYTVESTDAMYFGLKDAQPLLDVLVKNS